MPEIKSITLGVNIDFLCKQLLWDICKEKSIPCYELVLGHDNFSIERKPLTESDFEFNLDKELKYISLICETYVKNTEKMGLKISKVTEMTKEHNFDAELLIEADKSIIDCLADTYFIKSSIIRIFKKHTKIGDEKIPDELTNGATQIDIYVTENIKMVENQKETLIKLALGNQLSAQDYRHLLQLIFKIDSLLEKINALKWPNLICVTD